MLLIYSFKKGFKKAHFFEIVAVLKKMVYKLKYIIPFFLLANTNINNEIEEVEKISFSIIKKDSSIGFIDIKKASLNTQTTYIINSEVNTKVIFNFNAVGKEKSIYKGDTLIFSSVYRKLNHKVKLNQSLSFINGKYLLKNKNKKEKLSLGIINRNLVTLFFFEPKGVREVFSDKYKKMVKVTPMSKGKYKIVLPNRSTNIYHYKKGKCILVEAVGSFYKVKLISNNTIENINLLANLKSNNHEN